MGPPPHLASHSSPGIQKSKKMVKIHSDFKQIA